MNDKIGKPPQLDHDLAGAAIAYASKWPVLPLAWITEEGDCSCINRTGPCRPCPCFNPGKHTINKGGCYNATQDEAIIKSWWAKWPLANIGICTGRKSNLIVFEVNPRDGGNESLSDMQCRFGEELPHTLVCATGDGCWHFYLQYPEFLQIKGKVPGYPGVIIKADGDYVIAPPSQHISGNTFHWQTDWRTTAIARIPDSWS